ncbi:hypothetical protein PACTADRAFT_35917 [Pachysolen tannophilus NRRL Y-2460]|uniref:Uncharacterized protein n=1 Tax=Pachysolen tannophilus NRRL Y-2460 TaxID=669874 RepID=A0A1E4TNI0_PACTA|nr:hypothetical protein PACTADRAFT_35917 [Pachysolen tannophilus NRRL Y-2460]
MMSISSDPQKTTVIISNLAKKDFPLKESSNSSLSAPAPAAAAAAAAANLVTTTSSSLKLAEFLKLKVLQKLDTLSLMNDLIKWINLPTLSRIIIKFSTESTSKRIYEYLLANFSKDYPALEIDLISPLVRTRSTTDSMLIAKDGKLDAPDYLQFQDLNVHCKLKNSNNTCYQEPRPQKSPASSASNTPLASPIDSSILNVSGSASGSEYFFDESDHSRSRTPQVIYSPTQYQGKESDVFRYDINTGDCDYDHEKPNLSINTNINASKIFEGVNSSDSIQESPIITLDETFTK